MANVETLGMIASLIAGFSIVLLVFRIQNEAAARTEGLPWADWLLIAASLVALLLTVLPLVACTNRPGRLADLPAAGCAAAALLVAGYVPAILAHYRGGGAGKTAPAERIIVIATLVLAVVVFVIVLLRYPQPPQL